MPMPTYRKTNYSPIYVLLATVVICCLALAGPLVIRPLRNRLAGRMALHEFEAAFQDVQHPTGTERLSQRTAMGAFAGSDQGCDFFVGEVRAYDESEEVVLAVYGSQTVMDNSIRVLFLDGGQIPDRVNPPVPESLSDLAGWGISSAGGQQPLYMAYLVVVGYEGDVQLDCR